MSNYQYPNGRILVFAKAAIAGHVKTRLSPRLNAAQCALLHQRLVEQTLTMLSQAMLVPVELWYAEAECHRSVQQWCSRYTVPCRQQLQVDDLGQRLAQAMTDSQRRNAFTLIIGCDCAVLNAQHIAKACAFLAAQDNRVFINPTEDGGYILIGNSSKQVASDLFANIDWGSDSVFSTSQQRLQQLARKWALTWQQGDMLWDIDRPADLDRLQDSGYKHLLQGLL